MFVTGLTGVRNVFILDGFLWKQGLEYMAVQITGFGAFYYPGHMAANAIGEGVNRMSEVVVDDVMTG
jgi:hypothetical protein